MEQSRRKGAQRPYARMARVNALLHEVLAEQLARDADVDERLGLATITGVECSPDLKVATVFLSSLSEELDLALNDHRRHLQHALSSEVRIRRTPTLHFVADPAVAAGARIEAAIARSRRRAQPS